MVAGHAHHQRRQAEPDSLGGPAGEQPRERQLTSQTLPGVTKTWKVTVTNEGQKAQALTLGGSALNPASTSSASGTVTLSNSASDQFADGNGLQYNYATFKFNVPAGQGRLNVAIAYPGNPNTLQAWPIVVLYDPKGRVAGDSQPQGTGNFGNVAVRAPAAGRWTAVVSSPVSTKGCSPTCGYTGPVTWQETTQKFASFGSYSPSSLTLGPGKSGSFVLSVKAPAQPGGNRERDVQGRLDQDTAAHGSG
jgi:hypothetical protein